MEDGRIKKLETISKALFIISPFLVAYYSYSGEREIYYCLGIRINELIFFLPLILAVIFGIIAILIRRRYNLSVKDSIKKFLKFLIYSLIFSVVGLVMFVSLCGHRGKATDARRMSDLKAIYDAQKKFYEDNSRYAISFEELEETEYGKGILDEAKRFSIIFGDTKNPNTWRAYAYIKGYEHEICSTRKPKNVYICDQTGCREESIIE